MCLSTMKSVRCTVGRSPVPARQVRARADNSTKSNSPDALNESAKDDMKYVLREDMSNLSTNNPESKPETLPEAVENTLQPRVRELRGKKLAQGTTDFGGAMPCALQGQWLLVTVSRKLFHAARPSL
jgi:hypothetical protein